MSAIICKNQQETRNLAKSLASQLKGGEIIALEGGLGAGKTTLTQYLGQALAIEENMASPTFVLMKVYGLKNNKIKNLVHVDCYRLDDPQELFYLGLEEYLNNKMTVVVIEWADKIKKYLKNFDKVRWIKIKIKDSAREFVMG
jgi:tRNA threonylcarbamoyladenosine biosynthesis protein TsaE